MNATDMSTTSAESPVSGWIKRGAITVLFIAIIAAIVPFLSGALTPTKTKKLLTHTVVKGELEVTVT